MSLGGGGAVEFGYIEQPGLYHSSTNCGDKLEVAKTDTTANANVKPSHGPGEYMRFICASMDPTFS